MSRIKKILLFLFAINICYAATVTDLIDYREYRDFAENRGKYKVGNTNIVVTRKDGVTKTITVPMPDFSSTDSNAIGTLIDPTYVGGVKHNTLMTSVRFGYAGGHDYKFIDRNDYEGNLDRHYPRLNKIVTDVAPTLLGPGSADYKNTYEIYMRVGSGHQYVVNSETGEVEDIVRAYTYLTGGTLDKDFLQNSLAAYDRGPKFPNSIDKNILPIHLDSGDSGSPLWGYNKNTQQWELIGFGQGGSPDTSYYVPVVPDFYNEKMQEDTMPDVKDSNINEVITWSGINDAKGTGVIKQGEKEWNYDGLKSGSLLSSASNDDLNFTKHITFDGAGGTIQLQDSINMGAGKLTFKNDYTMEGTNSDISWVGAGIDITKDNTVTWKVKGQKGDNLHKIGDGTLVVEGTGVNEGGLNVGSGTVILNQQADSSGKKQAFSNIDIVSGRATVVLGDAQQIDIDKIRFMFRGGKLDINGNDLTFGKIVAYDDGAQIINNSNEKATLTVNVTNVSRPTLYKGHFGEKEKESANKIDLNIYSETKWPEYEDKSTGISGGINIDGDINFSSKGLNLVFQGVRDLHADEDPGATPGKGEYYMNKFKFNNLYVRDKVENEYFPHGFIGGIYSDIEGNIIIEDSSSVVLGYVNDKWRVETDYGSYEYGKTILLYDLKDQKDINDSISKLELDDSNVSDEIKEGTTIYKGNITIKDKGTLDVGATYFTGGIEALNSGSISMTNTKIEATLNIGENVTSSLKNTLGKFKDSNIKNNFAIVEKSELIFDNLTLEESGKLNIENSAVQIDNSTAITGDILVAKEGVFIGNKSTINNIVSNNSSVYLTDTDITETLNLGAKSEAILTNGTISAIDISESSILQAENTAVGKIELALESAINFIGGKIESLIGKEQTVTLLDGTRVENINLTSSTEDKGILISKGNSIANLLGDKAHIELANANIETILDLRNNSEAIIENGSLSNVILNNSTLMSYGTEYRGDTSIINKGILAASSGKLSNVKSENSTVITQGVKVLNIEVLSKSIFDTTGTTIENITVDNSEVISNSSIFNQTIVAKNSSNLDLKNSYVLGGIELENGSLKTNQTMIGENINIKNSNVELNNTTITGKLLLDGSDIVLNNVNYSSTSPLSFFSTESENTDSIITLANNSSLTGTGLNMVGDIKFTESNINLSNSSLIGVLNGTGEINLKNTTWYISDNSDIKNLLATTSDIRFISKNSNEFYSLTLDNLSGDSKLTFNANLETGESDKLVIRGEIPNSFQTEIDIDSVGEKLELNKEITVITGSKENIDKITVTNTTVDLGFVQGKVEIVNGSLGLKPETSLPSEPEVPEDSGDTEGAGDTGGAGDSSDIVIITPSKDELGKEKWGSTTTTMLNEYAARVEAIKNQNNLFKSEINFIQAEGVNYIGNTQHGRYETDKFREYSQTIINNGAIYKTNDVINSEWNLSKGIGFSYGKSIIDYEGEYTGRIDNYGVYGYLQFINKDGYYIAPNIGLTYNENKINSEKFYTKSQSIGVKLGYQKELENDMRLTFETGIDMYHISNSDYTLTFKNNRQNGKMDDQYFLELKPEVKIFKDLEITNNKTSLYTGVGLEYNKYMFGRRPVVEIYSGEYQAETAMIDKGANIKVGMENSYKNVDVTLEAEYFTGKYNNEKLKGNLKLKYKF